MSTLRLANAHQSQLEQLTGCRYATLRSLVLQVKDHLQNKEQRRGRPFQNSVLVMTTLALMKLRQNLTVRSLQAITGIDAVTISRCVNRIILILGRRPLAAKTMGCLLVDTTSARVATTQLKAYSGYKHHRCAKLQVIASEDGRIVDVSSSFAGSVHDKSIWNKEATRIKHLFSQLVLGDKAYAGGTGEGECLL